jgi:hypothetical protein
VLAGVVLGLGLGAGCGGGSVGAAAYAPVTTEEPGTLLSAWIDSDGTAYLAGGVVGGGDGLLMRWDGRVLATIPTPGAHAFWWIHGVASGDMFLAGEQGEVHHFDGTTVTRVDVGAPAGATLFGIWGTSDDDLWAVGGSFATGGPRQVILRGVGGTWGPVASPAGIDADVSYFKVWGPASPQPQVWIVGDRGVVLRDDGAGLALVADAPAAERYVTIHGCGSNDVYVVGGGAIGEAAHFDGVAWSALDLVDVPPLSGVACDGGVAYLGGYSGYAGRVQGGKVAGMPLPVSLQDLAIHGLAARGGHVLAVGGDLTAQPMQPQRGFAVELRGP